MIRLVSALKPTGFLLTSFAVHSAIFAMLHYRPVAPMAQAADTVNLEVVEAPPEPAPEVPPEAPTAPAPEPAPEPPPPLEQPQPPAERPPPPDAPADEPPPPAPETPVDFGNVTLSNTDGDSSWKIAPSTGKEMTGPIGTPGAAVTGRSRDGVVGGVVGGTNPDPVVPAGDLRRRPVPPSASLESLLKRNFPRDARRQGIEGTARIRVRLSRDGSVRVLRRLDESYPGFGQACATTLSQSPRWSPGIDRSGNPATTEFNFTCRFQME